MSKVFCPSALYIVSRNNSTANQHTHHMTTASSRRLKFGAFTTRFIPHFGEGPSKLQPSQFSLYTSRPRSSGSSRPQCLELTRAMCPIKSRTRLLVRRNKHPQAEYKWVGHIVRMLGTDFVDTHL
jgi:hypothetical protein